MSSLRPSLVVALSIPFSILFATLWMNYLGISSNLMSMGGLAIAIGMIVDGTIVVVENVDRTLREISHDESRLHTVGRACMEDWQTDPLRHHHYHHRLPSALHARGSRGQDLPAARLYGSAGHAGLARFYAVSGPDADQPADALAQTRRRRRARSAEPDPASFDRCVSSPYCALRPSSLPGGRSVRCFVVDRSVSLPAAGIGVYA